MVTKPVSWLSPAKPEKLGLIPSLNVLWLHHQTRLSLISIPHFTVLKEITLQKGALSVFTHPELRGTPGLFVLYPDRVVKLRGSDLGQTESIRLPSRLKSTGRVRFHDGTLSCLQVQSSRFQIQTEGEKVRTCPLTVASIALPYCFNLHHAFVLDQRHGLACVDLATGSVLARVDFPPTQKEAVSLVCHLREDVVAVAHRQGSVSVVRFEATPTRGMTSTVSVHHWHSMDVTSLRWSWDGQSLYTGGREQALVQWDLVHTTKTVVPRLGGTILGVAEDERDGSVLVLNDCHTLMALSNSLYPLPKVLTLSDPGHYQGQDCYWHAPTRTIMRVEENCTLNFFSVHENKVTWSMHMNPRNPTDSNHAKTQTPPLPVVSLSPNGRWLVFNANDNLELWRFETDSPERKFVLTASLFQSHHSPVLRTVVSDSPAFLTADEREIKLWQYSEEANKIALMGVISFKSKMPLQMAMSQDETVVAVAFHDSLTVWDRDQLALMCVLPLKDSTLSHLSFQDSSLVGVSEGSAHVWSLQSLGPARALRVNQEAKPLRNLAFMFVLKGCTLLCLDQSRGKMEPYGSGQRSPTKGGTGWPSDPSQSNLRGGVAKRELQTPALSTVFDHQCSLLTSPSFVPISSTVMECLEQCL